MLELRMPTVCAEEASDSDPDSDADSHQDPEPLLSSASASRSSRAIQAPAPALSFPLPLIATLLLLQLAPASASSAGRAEAGASIGWSGGSGRPTSDSRQPQEPQAADWPGAGRGRRRSDEGAECRGSAVFGLRFHEAGELFNGSLVVKAQAATRLLLIGRGLSSDLQVALTPSLGSARADCTHLDRVKSVPVEARSAHVAVVELELAAPGPNAPFYLCLRERGAGSWWHQGSDAWLRVYVKQELLPLHMKIVVIAGLLLLSGLFSGLNLGLMALDKHELQVIISCGSETEKRYARAIEPVRRRGNYLLCSILFSNVLVNSTIAVLLEELTSGIVAVITSTVFIVMFGEILPQAFCSRHGLAVGAKTVSITYFCMVVTFPLSYPVSFCLDWALGEEIGHAYDRERLMEFIRVTRDYNNLETDEVNIISGALKLKRIQLSEVMTRIEDVFMLDVEAALDFDTIQAILEKGYSRIPVHEARNKKNIVALLFAKDLALLDPDDRTPLQTLISFYNHPIMYLFEDSTLDSALNEFKTGKSHLAFVRRVIDDGDRDPVYEITGIVTLEDVIEEIMQMEINDETDILSDNRRKRRRKEAQVRQDFSQFAKLTAGASGCDVVTPQLRLAAYQFLATSVEPFAAKNISDCSLKRLLSQQIYYKVRAEDSRGERRLYVAGEPADYFVMILEGRVQVSCGKESILFCGGPFAHFGQAALQLAQAQSQLEFQVQAQVQVQVQAPVQVESEAESEGSGSRPRGSHSKRGPSLSCDLPTTSDHFRVSMRKLERSLQEAEASSVTCKEPPAALGSSNSAQTNDKPSRFFLPDYTVEVLTSCSYLKISSQEYLAAIRASLVERGAIVAEAGNDANPHH